MTIKSLTNRDILNIQVQAFKSRIFKGIVEKRGLTHEKMRQALLTLTDKDIKEFVYGGAAGGAKSFTGAYWLLMSCLAYPGIRCYVARKRLKDLVGTTLPTFHKVRKELGIYSSVFSFNAQRNVIKFANGSEIYFLSANWEPSDPEYERLGSLEFTLGWIEEGGEVPVGAFEVLKTRTGRQLNDKYGLLPKTFITANPTKNWIYRRFYQARLNLEYTQEFSQAFVYDNPFIDSEYIKQLEGLPEGNKKQRLLYGNWEFDDDPTALIEYQSILDMFSLDVGATKEKFLICDASRDGGDYTTAFVFAGLQIIELKSWNKEKTNISAQKIAKIAIRHRIPASRILVDANGIGGGVIDQLPAGVVEFVNNARAMNDENYKSLKDQCGYMLAQYINEERIGMLGCEIEEDVRERIIEELEWIKSYEDEKGGKARILPKDKIKEAIGRSPDYSDTLLMRMYFELKAKKSTTKQNNNMINLIPYNINPSKFVNVSWYIGTDNNISAWFWQTESTRDVRVIDYLEDIVTTPSDFMFLFQEKVRENQYIISQNTLAYMKVDAKESDSKADIYRLLKKLGLDSVKIMPKVEKGEDIALIRSYFHTFLFRAPVCDYGYYKIKDDSNVEEMATKALIPLIQASTLREQDTLEYSVNSLRDVKRLMHSDNPILRKKAERLGKRLK